MYQLFLWVIYILGVLEQFGTENYTWKLDIVQNLWELWQFSLSDFLGSKCFNTPGPKYGPGDKMFQYPEVVYHPLPLFTLWLFSTLLNDDIVGIEKPYEICSPTFVMDDFSGLMNFQDYFYIYQSFL